LPPPFALLVEHGINLPRCDSARNQNRRKGKHSARLIELAAILARDPVQARAQSLSAIFSRALGPIPFLEDAKEAGHVLDHLAAVLARELALSPPLPNRDRLINKVASCAVRRVITTRHSAITIILGTKRS